MADLFARVQGDRPTSAVCNSKPLQVEVMTSEGLLRIVLELNGDYTVYQGDPERTGGATGVMQLGHGNVNDRSFATDGHDVDNLQPIKVRHRPSPLVAPSPSATAKTSPSAATKTASGAGATASPATTATPTSTAPSTPASSLTLGDFRAGVKVTNAKGDSGEVTNIGEDVVGKYVSIEWKEAGYEDIYESDIPKAGLVLAKEKAPAKTESAKKKTPVRKKTTARKRSTTVYTKANYTKAKKDEWTSTLTAGLDVDAIIKGVMGD